MAEPVTPSPCLDETEVKAELITLSAVLAQASAEEAQRIASGPWHDGMALHAVEKSVERLWGMIHRLERTTESLGRGLAGRVTS